jgi:hypothetical protein
MSKIYLNDIIEFCDNVYTKDILKNNSQEKNLIDKINTAIQNDKLNNNNFKCNFVDILSLTKYYEQNELILISSLSFDFSEDNKSYFYFMNSVLTILKNNYIFSKKNEKKKLINSVDELFTENFKKLKNKKNEIFNQKVDCDKKKYIYEQVASVLKICIFIIENTSFNLYGFTDGDEENNKKKFVIIYKYNEYYFPVINWKINYYEYNSSFVTELLKKHNNKKKIKFNEDVEIPNNPINENDSEIDDDDDDDDDDKNEYKEFVSNHKSAVFMSEAVTLLNDMKDKSKKVKKDKIKKSSEKDVFIEKADDDSIYKTSSKITNIDRCKIIKDTKISMKLELLQENASKLGLMTVQKDKKTGKLKNKTKSDLYEEIKNIK